MNLLKATDDDNDRLMHYFAQATLPGPIQFKLRRMFNFYNQYRIQSDQYSTYILQNDKDKIEATASLVFRSGVVEGQPEYIGYATDLRVSPTRNAIVNWTKHFLPVIDEEKRIHNCRYLFSVVAHAQRQAYNAFIRPRNVRRNMPRYHLFRRFHLVYIHGVWPFHTKPLPGIRIRSANENDFAQLSEYILRKTKQSPVKYFHSAQDFRQNLARWRDLSIQNFLLAFDRHNNLIGCTAPWNPERIQRTIVVEYDAKTENLKDFLRILSVLKLAHPLPKPSRELEMRHLTHLFADNPDIFYSLTHQAFMRAGPREVLVYPHFEGDLITMPPRSLISSDTPFGLYCILSPQDQIPDFLRPRSMQTPPVFEPAFL